MFAAASLQTAPAIVPPPVVFLAPSPAAQTEMAPSAIMMLSEARGGEATPIPSTHPPAPQEPTWGAPCPNCGKALGKRGRHFHVRACRG